MFKNKTEINFKLYHCRYNRIGNFEMFKNKTEITVILSCIIVAIIALVILKCFKTEVVSLWQTLVILKCFKTRQKLLLTYCIIVANATSVILKCSEKKQFLLSRR
jgi:hypothetical protein